MLTNNRTFHIILNTWDCKILTNTRKTLHI